MNISNINNFINVKNNILKCFVHEVAQSTYVSIAVEGIYRWRNEVFRRHVAQAKRIFTLLLMGGLKYGIYETQEKYINYVGYRTYVKYINRMFKYKFRCRKIAR